MMWRRNVRKSGESNSIESAEHGGACGIFESDF